MSNTTERINNLCEQHEEFLSEIGESAKEIGGFANFVLPCGCVGSHTVSHCGHILMSQIQPYCDCCARLLESNLPRGPEEFNRALRVYLSDYLPKIHSLLPTSWATLEAIKTICRAVLPGPDLDAAYFAQEGRREI